jgi:hypothetical protein
MSYNLKEAQGEWSILETVLGGGPKRRHALMGQLGSASHKDFRAIMGQLRLLSIHGCPLPVGVRQPNIHSLWKLEFVDGKSRTRVPVYELKMTPLEWRLYFIVSSRQNKEIEIIYVVQKKK